MYPGRRRCHPSFGRRLSDGCPIRSSKSEWDDNPKAWWVREGGIAFTGYHIVRKIPSPENSTSTVRDVIGGFLGATVRHPSVLPSNGAHQNTGTRYGSDCDQGQRRSGGACLTPM